jgi:hypothetical protein
MRGWLYGVNTATAVTMMFFMWAVVEATRRTSASQTVVGVFTILVCGPLVWLVTCALSAIPAALTIRLSEKFRIQSILFFSAVGGVIGGFSLPLMFRSFTNLNWLFAVAGCLAGLSYWYMAGRYAGEEDSGEGIF